jgi:hypothetical protein
MHVGIPTCTTIRVPTSVGDALHFGVDPDSDPDPAISVIDLQDANKKLI